MQALLSEVEWLLLIFVFLSAILSVLQIASLLSFYGILVMFMKPETVIPIATIFFLSMNVTKMTLFRSEVDWRLTRTLVIASAPGVLVGAWLLVYLPSDLVRRVVCGFVIGFLVLDVLKIKMYEVKNTSAAVVTVGLGYGLLSGFLGSGSIVRTPLLLRMNLTKGAFIGTAAAASLFSNIVKIGSYGSTGLMTPYVVINGALSIVIGLVGARVGKQFVDRISDESFTNVVRISLLVGAVAGLVR